MRIRNERISIRTLDITFCIIHVWNGLFERLFEWKVRVRNKVRDSSDMIYTLSVCACDDWERVVDWKGEQK